MSHEPTKKELRERWAGDGFVFASQSALESVFNTKNCHEAIDLRGVVVGLDGPINWLAWADLQDAHLKNVDFSFAKFSCSFIRGQFERVHFTGSEFDTCRLAKAHFVEVDFTRSLLLAPWLEDAVFIACRFDGARLRGRGKLFPNSSGSRIKFERCDFRGCIFEWISMAGIDFVDCKLETARFKECHVFNWRFKGNLPTQEQFHNCQYRGKNVGPDFLEGSPEGPI